MLHKTLIFSVLLHGGDSWTLSKTAELILGAFERKIPVCEEGDWRRRYNRELYELYQDVDVVGKAKIWLGHIERMDNNAPSKSDFASELPGSRKRERSNLRNKDQVIAGARKLKLDYWKQRAQDRQQWKAAIAQTMTFMGRRPDK